MRAVAIVLLAVAAQLTTPAPLAPVNVRVVTGLAVSTVGPQASIVRPAGSVAIAAPQDINVVVEANPPGTTFWIQGTHRPTRPIAMQAGDQLIGEFGAVIDGTAVTQAFDQGGIAIVSGWNCAACANVTVRNVIIRNTDDPKLAPFGRSCIGAFGPNAGGWIIDHNEISGCRWGVNFGNIGNGTLSVLVPGPTVTWNIIHDNVWGPATSTNGAGAYGIQATRGTVFADNDVVANGGEPKFTSSVDSQVLRGHFFDNAGPGVWFDGDNTNGLVDGVTSDRNLVGVMVEISAGILIRHSSIRFNREHGIYISTSRGVEASENTLEGNWRGIQGFVNCAAIYKPDGSVGGPNYPYPGAIGFDLRDNNIHENIVRVSATPVFSYANGVTYDAQCTAAQVQLYLSGSKHNAFTRNTYRVPTLTDRWWLWGDPKTWTQWQAVGQDLTGVVQ